MTKKSFTQESAAATAAAAAHAAAVFATSGKRPEAAPAPQADDGRPKRNRKAATTQCNFRVEVALRERLANAAVVWRMSERDIIELFLRSLPEFVVPRQNAPQAVSLQAKK